MAKKKEKSTWNYRVLAHEDANADGGVWFQLHDVYYTNEVPHSYGTPPATIGSETIEGVKDDYRLMGMAIGMLGSHQSKYKILWAGDKFPKEYEPLKK